MKMTDDWPNSRSISSFQTFPRTHKNSGSINGYLNMNGVNSSLSQKYDLIPGTKPPEIFDAISPSLEETTENHDDNEEDLIVKITLGTEDRRFGFSVVGGSDEGFPPRIDELSPGSPADKADLEVGDEILEVNGKSLEDATHAEVIAHIHQCIRSRTICLRVKRKSGNKIALDLAQNSNVQDAFVIAVEQQAQERLEKLSALKKIKPFDMTKLSQELSKNSKEENQDLNGIIESNSIYVTSVPELNHSSTKKDDGRKASTNIISTKFGAENSEQISSNHFGETGFRSEEEIELKQEITDWVPVHQSRNSRSSHQERELRRKSLTQQESSSEESLTQSSSKYIQKPLTEGLLETKSTMSKSGYNNRQHREMAVDVPDTFVGSIKTTPKYPPPKTRVSGEYKKSTPVYLPHNNGTLPKSGVYKEGHGKSYKEEIPPTRGNTLPQLPSRDSKKPMLGPKPVPVPITPLQTFSSSDKQSKSSTTSPGKGLIMSDTIYPPTEMTSSLQDDQMERIRKYQEDIRKRKEEEERIAREQEFLRTSLRGSKKLQALEQNPPQQLTSGFINTAFELDDSGDAGHLGETDDDPSSGSYYHIGKLVGPAELISSVQRLENHLRRNGQNLDEELRCLTELLHDQEFQKALAVHNKIQEVWCFQAPPTPSCTNAQDLTQEVLNFLNECSLPEATELVELLNKFEFESLIYAHDKIAENEEVPAMTPDEELLDRVSQYTEDSIKIVKIDKTNEPLGATVRNEGESVIIGRIVKGGAAEKSGLLHEGDEVLEVNGIEMRGKSVNDVCDILANMTGTLTFLIIPTPDERTKPSSREIVMHVKAHFDYDPEDDLYIPCRELGISFQKGDILHVINQDDPNWWQAYREGEEDQSLAGLIPSKTFQQQREAMKQTIVGDTNNKENSKKARFLCARKNQKKKKKKVLYSASCNEDYDSDEILTYEEVALYYPRANRKRPIVLIGPPNIGRHELRQKLMEDVDRFAAAVPHTSRPKQDGEIDGQDYYFITRPQFEADIYSRKFVEHGEYEKNYYGTSLDAIRTVVNSGKICVLNLHPQSLKILKASDLKPFVVFVAPPSLEKLRQNRNKLNVNIRDEELKEIIEKAREMEDSYGHYFDMIIINSDLERAYTQLLQEINILEREPQWVPAAWLKTEIN